MTTETPTRTVTLQDRIVDALREPGLDVAAVRNQVEAAGRKRRLLARAGMAAAVVVALLGSVVFLAGRDNPDEIKADRGRPTSTLPAASTTVLTQVADSTVPVTPQISAAPLLAAPAPTTTAPRSAPPPTVTTTASTTTAPPANQPLDFSARVLGVEAPGGVRAGRTVTVEVSWSDPDNADPSGPRIAADFGDRRVQLLPDEGGRPACHARGQRPSGAIRISFRYTTPGPHSIRIRATTCEGQGDFAEAVEKDVPISVGDPVMEDGSAARVVIAYSTVTSHDPDAATATFNGSGNYLPPRTEIDISPKVSSHRAYDTTLLLVPAGQSGEIRLSWPGGPCISGFLEAGDTDVLVSEPRNDC